MAATTIYYNNSTISSSDQTTPVAIKYGGSTIASVSAGQTKTLNCSGKYMSTNVTVGNKTLLCANKRMSGNVSVKVQFNYKRVGGRIFYITGSLSAYTFYDIDGDVISTKTVSGLANAYYYSISGTPSYDHVYVFDDENGLSYKCKWSSSYSSVGTSDGIGAGKTNTETALSSLSSITSTIWEYVDDLNNIEKTGGCSDWYVGSKAELEVLRNTGLFDGFNDYWIFSSTEDSTYPTIMAMVWEYNYSRWNGGTKDNKYKTVAIRSF